MSLSETSQGQGSPPPPKAYPYGSEGGDPSRLGGPTTLPPMSSLFRHDPTPELHQPSPYLARQFQPPYNMLKEHPLHPLSLSERDPNAPVLHYYQPPQSRPNSHFAQSLAETMLVPTSGHHTLAFPPRHRSPTQQPHQQQRQFKKIVQRQQDPSKSRRQSPTSMPSGQNEEMKTRSPTKEPEACQSLRRPSNMSEPERRMSSHSYSSQDHNSQGHTSRSMPISGLLSDVPTYVTSTETHRAQANESSPTIEPPKPTFTIRMRQQPLAARACGFGERDRRVIDPPPILQMDVDAPNATPEELKALLRQPFAVVHCTLWDPVNDRDDTAMPGTTDKRQQRRLMGTLVASPFVGNDEHDVEGCFFCFPDLSVRTPGTYSLKFSLVTLDPTKMGPGFSMPVRSTVKSAVFHVYNAKDFGGMRASTELTKKLKHQGCLISVKKGNAKSNGKNGKDEDDDEDDDDDDDLDEGPKRKAAKRPKR
jgi:Velvet factor